MSCRECGGNIVSIKGVLFCSNCWLEHGPELDSTPHRTVPSSSSSTELGNTFHRTNQPCHPEIQKRSNSFLRLSHPLKYEDKYSNLRRRGEKAVNNIIREVSAGFEPPADEYVKEILNSAHEITDLFFGKKVEGRWHVFYDKRGKGRRIEDFAIYIVNKTIERRLIIILKFLGKRDLTHDLVVELDTMITVLDKLWEKYPELHRITRRESKHVDECYPDEVDSCYPKLEENRDQLYKLFIPPIKEINYEYEHESPDGYLIPSMHWKYDLRNKHKHFRQSTAMNVFCRALSLFEDVVQRSGRKPMRGLMPACIYISAIKYSTKRFLRFSGRGITYGVACNVFPAKLSDFAKTFGVSESTIKKRIFETEALFNKDYKTKIDYIQGLIKIREKCVDEIKGCGVKNIYELKRLFEDQARKDHDNLLMDLRINF